jgi:WD40 repeat protein
MRQYKLRKMKRIHGVHFTRDGSRLLVVGGWEVGGVECAAWLTLATGANDERIKMLANGYAVDPHLTRYVLAGANDWAEIQEGIAAVQWTRLDGPRKWRTFPLRGRTRPPFGEVYGLTFDATGTRLAIGHASSGGRHGVSIVQRDAIDRRTTIITEQACGAGAFSANGTRFAASASVDGDPTVSVYAVSPGERLFTYTPPGTVTRDVRFLSDNRLVVANGRNVYVLAAVGGAPQFTFSGHPKQVNAVALTPDAQRLLTASHDGSIRVWNVNTGEPGPIYDWGIGPVTAVCFAPDGLTCAAAGLNGKVVVWDVDG